MTIPLARSTGGISVCPILAAVLLLAGCAAPATGKIVHWYEGPPRGTNEIARLEVIRSFRGETALIWKVDAKSINAARADIIQEIEFLPGPHTMAIGYAEAAGRSKTNMTLFFWCAASHVYELHVAPMPMSFGKVFAQVGAFDNYHWTAWIADRDTGEVIAGRRREEPAHWYE